MEGEAQSFLDHIRLGIETAAGDPTALLLFSGGQTRKAAGPRSEGLSYWLVAEAAGWWGHKGVRGRAYTEVSTHAHACRGRVGAVDDKPLLQLGWFFCLQTAHDWQMGSNCCDSAADNSF